MQININGHNCEIDGTLKNYTQKKLKKLESYHEIITSTHITYYNDKHQQTAEGHIHVPGAELHAKADHATQHGAMDSLIDKLIKQLVKYKEKNNGHR